MKQYHLLELQTKNGLYNNVLVRLLKFKIVPLPEKHYWYFGGDTKANSSHLSHLMNIEKLVDKMDLNQDQVYIPDCSIGSCYS